MKNVLNAAILTAIASVSGCTFYPGSSDSTNSTPSPSQGSILEQPGQGSLVKIFRNSGPVQGLLVINDEFEHSTLSEDQKIEKAFLAGILPFSDKLISRTQPRVTSKTTDYDIKVVTLRNIDREVAVKQLSNLNFKLDNLIITDITYRLLYAVNNILNIVEFDVTYMDETDQVVKTETFRFDSTNVATIYKVKKEVALQSLSEVAANAKCVDDANGTSQACEAFRNKIIEPGNIINKTVNQFCYFGAKEVENSFSYDVSTITQEGDYSPESAVASSMSGLKSVYFGVNQFLDTPVSLPNGEAAAFYTKLVIFNYNKETNSYSNVKIKGSYVTTDNPTEKETIIPCNPRNQQPSVK